MNWCSFCNCQLPTQRDGTVLRVTRREHNQGQKHANSVERQRQEARDQTRRQLEACRLAHAKRIADARQALLLAVVAARLRAAHGSMDAARTVWAVEADAALNQLESPALKAALWRPATAHVAQQHVRSAALDSWLVVKLVVDVAGA
jgi:hypothetical protein